MRRLPRAKFQESGIVVVVPAGAAGSNPRPAKRGEHRRPPAAVLGAKDADAKHRLWRSEAGEGQCRRLKLPLPLTPTLSPQREPPRSLHVVTSPSLINYIGRAFGNIEGGNGEGSHS